MHYNVIVYVTYKFSKKEKWVYLVQRVFDMSKNETFYTRLLQDGILYTEFDYKYNKAKRF